jgi:hypothetical protein
MKYEATIETPNGEVNVSYTDEQITEMGGTAALLRDGYHLGVAMAPSEVAAQAWRQETPEVA